MKFTTALSPRRYRRSGIALVTAAAVISMGAVSTTVASAAPAEPIDPSVLEPVDPQNWKNMDDMTWDDYTPIPGADWVNKTEGSQRAFKGAIVLLDFTDQDFLVTQADKSHVFGNPSGLKAPIPREEVPQFYVDLLNKPSALNHGRTINEYWMEQSNGRISVDMEAFGPYELPGKIHEYGLNDSFNKPNATSCPQGDSCNKVIRPDALKLWSQDIGVANPLAEFDEVFYVTAGHDESSTWEEFGQMVFASPEQVTNDFGPPRDANGKAYDQNGNEMANWAKTRYVPWTSWAAATSHWPNANFPTATNAGNSTQAESSGMGTFAHEFSHILGIADNYGNPYGTDANDGGALRDPSGPYDVLGRGSFNGPGGTHKRWGVPSVAGGSQPAGVALRNRLNLDIIDPVNVVDVTRSQVAAQGSLVTNLLSRAVTKEDRKLGINLKLDGGDLSNGSCTRKEKFDCDGGSFDNYTLEVVDRMGTDSFQPDAGVMLAKTKNADRNPFIWTIDANPQDIDTLDYVRADGTPIKITRGDQRQLNDALFHAGNNSGSEFEYVDELNRLHFYVVDKQRDEQGLLSYDVAVRSLDNAGPQTRGVALGEGTFTGTSDNDIVELSVPVTNTGGQVKDASANSDIYRVSTTVAGEGWTSQTPSSIVTIPAGETVNVPVYATRAEIAAAAARALPGENPTVSVTVTSENDPTATATAAAEIPAPAAETTPPTTTPGNPGTGSEGEGSGTGGNAGGTGGTDGLASTGSDLAPFGLTALALLLMGAALTGLKVRSRRRESVID